MYIHTHIHTHMNALTLAHTHTLTHTHTHTLCNNNWSSNFIDKTSFIYLLWVNIWPISCKSRECYMRPKNNTLISSANSHQSFCSA